MCCLIDVQHQDIQVKNDGRDAVVRNGVFEPQDAGDALSVKKTKCLVADRGAADGRGGAEEEMDLTS
jgi:hypothetical protein